MIDRILNLLTLDPVEDYSLRSGKTVSLPCQWLIRVSCWGILMVVFADPLRNAMLIFLGEILWFGISRLQNAEDLLAHVMAVASFVSMFHLFKSKTLIIAIFLALCFLSKFDSKELLTADKIDHKRIVEWQMYHERQHKYVFSLMVIAFIVQSCILQAHL